MAVSARGALALLSILSIYIVCLLRAESAEAQEPGVTGEFVIIQQDKYNPKRPRRRYRKLGQETYFVPAGDPDNMVPVMAASERLFGKMFDLATTYDELGEKRQARVRLSTFTDYAGSRAPAALKDSLASTAVVEGISLLPKRRRTAAEIAARAATDNAPKLVNNWCQATSARRRMCVALQV